MPPQGIELPADAVIYPIGHMSTITVGRAHGGCVSLPDVLPSAHQVAHGWLAQTQRASRLQLPDAAMVAAVTAARCELLLNGPAAGLAGLAASDAIDPAAFILGVAELVRMGDRPSIWVPEIATQLERLARSGAQIGFFVVEAAARVLHAAGEHKALADLRRMKLIIDPDQADNRAGEMPVDAALVPSWVERQLVTSDDHSAQLMPNSFPRAWLGVDFEAHGVAIGSASTLSFAIRWHGERPAVLWEVHGPPMPLTHGEWSTGQLTGEALWAPISQTSDTSFS
jgi:hypothetical protein